MKLRFCSIKLFVLLSVVLLASCSNEENEKVTGQSESIQIQDYQPSMGGYSASYLIDATTASSSDDFKENYLLYVPNEEVITVQYGNYSDDGEDSDIIMKVYYDYQEIDFKITDADAYQSEYKFSLDNEKKIEIPILLDEDSIVADENLHKLLVTFSTGAHQNASDFEMVTSEFGISAVYDVVHTLNYENTVHAYAYDDVVPENNFEQSYEGLVFNTDYDNVTQNSEFGGVLNPTPSLTVERNTDLNLMYNVEKRDASNVLLLATLNFEQVDINEKYAELIKLDGNEGTANGSIKIKVPDTPGKYEVIGYAIHDPFEQLSSISNSVSTSYRFTLLVE